MEGKDFEKKSSKKKFIISGIIALVLIAAIIGGVVYLNLSKKPEKIFAKAVENIFEIDEKQVQNSMRAELELTAEVDSEDVNVKAVNEYLKTLKIKLVAEQDLDKKIFNENIMADFNGEEVISLDALIQDENMYIYLNELFSKYIKIDEEYLEGIDLSTIFEQSADENFIKDLEQLLLDEINSKELKQEDVELDGKKVTKSTLKLSPKDILKIAKKAVRILERYQLIDDSEGFIDEIDYAIEEMGDIDVSKNYLEISIFTKGFSSKFVKAEAIIVEDDNELLKLEINKKSDDEVSIEFYINEDTTELKNATKLFEIVIDSENENKGELTFKMDIEDVGTLKVNLKYNVEYGVKVEKRDVSAAVNINELTEDDLMEIYENAQENEILYSIITSMMGTGYDDYDYDLDYDYNWDTEVTTSI